MRKAFAFLFLIGIANIAFLSASLADVPMIITYQGELTDSNGDPVNGVYSTAFSLYESPEGGGALWSETLEIVYTEGLFTVQLGAGTPFPDEIFGAQLWLGVNVDDQGELSPLIPLTSSAFSIRAKYVDLLTEENIQQFWALAASMADADGDGYIKTSQGGDDCDDFNPEIHPGADEICDGVDNDCDGTIDNNAVDCPEGFICINAECVIADADGDGYNADVDCDDNNPQVYPGAPELCDGLDNDCNGTIDDGADNNCPAGMICIDGACAFEDADGDGYPSDIDCDDNDPNTHPGAPEICGDDIDNDCDGQVDNVDNDFDGFYCYEDCDDFDPNVHPGAPEYCDGLDNDCNGTVDDGADIYCPSGMVCVGGVCVFVDADGDGYPSDIDCDDNDPNTYPGAPEICGDDIDNDCDGQVDNVDNDFDGFYCYEDCDDFNSNIHPGAPEYCDGWDNDCNGTVDDNTIDCPGCSVCIGAVCVYVDGDGDGWTCDIDCDDGDPNTYPGAPEFCDGVDRNCNGIVFEDMDSDGWPCNLDCDDTRSDVYPGAPELCDGVDNDCDTIIDEGCP